MNEPIMVVTGATGFIGRWLLAELTAGRRSVVALVRNATRRADELVDFVDRHGGDGARLTVLDADLHREDLGIERPLGEVGVVFHLAAQMEFGLTVEGARRNNVQTTVNVARWASRQRSLRRVVLLGGYRMTRPEPALRAFERATSEREILELYRGRGAYEVSKHEAYHAFRRLAEELSLPWSAVHPSSVIGDSRTGETLQRTGLADTARSLYEGRMPAMVGGERAFVPVVAVDHVARVLATVDRREETLGQDLVVLASDTPLLRELIARLAARMGRRPPRWSLPVGLVRAMPRWMSGVDREALDFIADDRYDTESADEHARAMGIVAPDTLATIDRWCDYLVKSQFLQRKSA
ncbi:MAG: SDR family oxidoreductase [Myxococcales bacterium]|nr:SDR family oxidoreductase [Myxococcales bacterium]